MTRPRLDRLPQRPLSGGLSVARANRWSARLLGLAWLDHLPAERGLHIDRCGSVHTFGMRFALDLIWLDAHGTAVRVDRRVPRRRLRRCRRARSVIEVAGGRAGAFLAAGAGGRLAADPSVTGR